MATPGGAGGGSDGSGIAYDGTAPGFTGDADPATTTDPADSDSDDDGLDDGVEDANGDGQTLNTIGDSARAGSGETDPNQADTDSDGLDDGDEVNGTGPLAGLGTTDPLDADSDDGGTQDGTEVLAAAANPLSGNGADDAALAMTVHSTRATRIRSTLTPMTTASEMAPRHWAPTALPTTATKPIR